MTRPGDRRPDQRGIATVWACAWIGLLMTVGSIGLCAAAAVASQHHLDGAADLSALSGAERLQRGGDPCMAATEVAKRNRAEVSACTVRGADVVLTVRAPLDLPFGLHLSLSSAARAGPA